MLKGRQDALTGCVYIRRFSVLPFLPRPLSFPPPPEALCKSARVVYGARGVLLLCLSASRGGGGKGWMLQVALNILRQSGGGGGGLPKVAHHKSVGS